MSKDSEIAEVGKILTEEAKKRRQARFQKWEGGGQEQFRKFLEDEYDVALNVHTPFHASFVIGGLRYDYWASNNRLRASTWKESKFLNPSRLVSYIRNHHKSTKKVLPSDTQS